MTQDFVNEFQHGAMRGRGRYSRTSGPVSAASGSSERF